jgi:hypothetical protein
MRRPKAKPEVLYVRVSVETKQAFNEKAARFGLPSEVLRELVQAFVEDRVTVSPPKEMKESLYNVARNED